MTRSLAHWSTFGNSIGAGANVRSDTQAVLDGVGSLKLYGQFNGTQNFSGVQQGISVTAGEELLAQASVLVNSADSILGTDSSAVLTIDYFSKQYGLCGSTDYLGSDSIQIANGSTSNDQWLAHSLSAIVPVGAVEARLGLVFVQSGLYGGAVHVDNVRFAKVSSVTEPGSMAVLAVLARVALGARRRRGILGAV